MLSMSKESSKYTPEAYEKLTQEEKQKLLTWLINNEYQLYADELRNARTTDKHK